MLTVRFAEAVQLPLDVEPTVMFTVDEKLPLLSQPLTVIRWVPVLIESD